MSKEKEKTTKRGKRQAPPVETEEMKVARWRAETFRDVFSKRGVEISEESIQALVDSKLVDHHRLDDLLDQGCPPETAVQILV